MRPRICAWSAGAPHPSQIGIHRPLVRFERRLKIAHTCEIHGFYLEESQRLPKLIKTSRRYSFSIVRVAWVEIGCEAEFFCAAAPSLVRKQPTSSGARSEMAMPSETRNLQLRIGRA